MSVVGLMVSMNHRFDLKRMPSLQGRADTRETPLYEPKFELGQAGGPRGTVRRYDGGYPCRVAGAIALCHLFRKI